MSDETKKPEAQEKSQVKEEVAPPQEPGEFGQLISDEGLNVEHLGSDANGIEMVRVAAKDLLKVAEFIKSNHKCMFDFLVSVTGIDWKDYRESVNHFYSTESHKTFCIKVNAEDDKVPSLMSIYPAADWHEREGYDLLGIIYTGHPDLRRILMPSDWIGFPLRKDYKVEDPRLIWNER